MLGAFMVGFGAGIAATPHCLGMCGGFPLYLSRSSARKTCLVRPLLFVIGKSFTYVFLGVLAAALGIVLFKNISSSLTVSLVRVAAGVLTVTLGGIMLGFKLPPIKALQSAAETAFSHDVFGGLLGSTGRLAAFVLGLGVGFLPCPLPLGMLAVAAASHNVSQGAALLGGVGIGTAPGLLAAGAFGVGLDRRFAKPGLRAAGIVVLAIGLLTIGRATGVIAGSHHANHRAVGCCCGRMQ